jgi:long-subunit fatty acid transport protein
MKQTIIITFVMILSHSISAQMLTANAGIALVYSNDFNYRMAYTYSLNKRFDVGLGVHYVGYRDNFFSGYQTDNGLQYKGKGDNPVLWYDEFIRGTSREGKDKYGDSFSLIDQVFHIGIFAQYNIIQKEKWNFGVRVSPNIVIIREQLYVTLVEEYSTLQINENSEKEPFVYYEKEVTSLKKMSISPSIYANYKLTPNFWLGVDYSMPFYISGGVDMLPSLSISYLF